MKKKKLWGILLSFLCQLVKVGAGPTVQSQGRSRP